MRLLIILSILIFLPINNMLNDRQKQFCLEYLVDLNATQAAIRSGYSTKTAGSVGSENLTKPEIVKEIKKQIDKTQDRTKVKIDRIVKELEKIVFFDIKSIVKDYNECGVTFHTIDNIDGATIAHISEKHNTKDGIIYIDMKPHDKLKAIELLGKHYKMYTDMTGLDPGTVTTPLKEIVDQLKKDGLNV